MKSLHVAVGILKSQSGEVLIAKRKQNLHLGGLWEFPGGKIEAGESVKQALLRELKEEIGIDVLASSPLITVKYQYSEMDVQLHVCEVDSFAGEAHGREGQAIKWVSLDAIDQYAFPAANVPIITALRLPPYYAILDDTNSGSLITDLKLLLSQGIKLVQARLKHLSAIELNLFLEQAYPLCRQHQTELLLNSVAAPQNQVKHIDGIHLTSFDLMQAKTKPFNAKWLAASCHNLAELKQAEKIGVDFAVLAPVLPTPTHPDAEVLGWQRFAELVEQVNVPVYALGGMQKTHLAAAKKAGAQGIAAIRAFLK